MVRVKLREAPQRRPKTNYCSDLRQVQHTLKTAEQVLEKLRYAARRVEDQRLLLGNKLTTKEEECLAGIKSDTASLTIAGVEKGLNRLVEMIDGADSAASQNRVETNIPHNPTEDWTLDEHRMRARAHRLVGVPPCIAIDHDLQCRCCFVE